jgi:hypothetical protein
MFIPNEYKGMIKSLTNIPGNYKEYLFDEFLFSAGIPPERFQLEFQILAGQIQECYSVAYSRMFFRNLVFLEKAKLEPSPKRLK